MTRLIDVLNDQERAVKNRIFVLREEEERLLSSIGPIRVEIQQLKTTVRNLERQEDNLRQKLKSSKLKRFKPGGVYPEKFDWDTRTTY